MATLPDTSGATADFPDTSGATPGFPDTSGATADFPDTSGATPDFPDTSGAAADFAAPTAATADFASPPVAGTAAVLSRIGTSRVEAGGATPLPGVLAPAVLPLRPDVPGTPVVAVPPEGRPAEADAGAAAPL